jgi:hypothetical protein
MRGTTAIGYAAECGIFPQTDTDKPKQCSNEKSSMTAETPRGRELQVGTRIQTRAGSRKQHSLKGNTTLEFDM